MGDIPAGEWRLIADCIIIQPVDTTFELLWRRGGVDTEIATWTEHFEPIGNGEYRAQPFENVANAAAIDQEPGDLLVFRYTGENATNDSAWVPNGDGAELGGRIPHIVLPQ